ncbi:hypothetical protein DNU06_08860 [Putridiphycobacter roseus]|uniref:Lipoprotein n=1 Tax=Putridiphycobacter roseus TaxID=2219161 RepID=A0A2W1N2Z3_9FLAO|nr:hypothetical protein [Putridiphycobacter roseus]PZE17371.1 hypothetical protein DNU06_08860 [Putridiphycobacter roseus]
MKKLTIMIFTGLLLASCGNAAAEKKAEEEKAAALKEMTSEINTMDSLSTVFDESAHEIEAASDELNQLLNEL